MVIIIFIAFIVQFWFRPDYVQHSCKVDLSDGSNYAIVEVDEPDKVGQRFADWDIQFSPEGLVVRFPPMYYAPDW